jgi:hypothetical protein
MTIRILRSKKVDGVRKFVVNSATDARRRYVITRRTASKWQCSCPRWIFGVKQADGTRRRENCKHILMVRGAA